jgi:hypothetical protein
MSSDNEYCGLCKRDWGCMVEAASKLDLLHSLWVLRSFSCLGRTERVTRQVAVWLSRSVQVYRCACWILLGAILLNQ